MDRSWYLPGDNIFLREVALSDVNQDYYNWLNDPDVNRYLETRFIPQSLESIETFVKSKLGSKDEQLFAICLKEQGRHIGNIKLGPIDWLNRRGVISLFIGAKDCWGKGLASEAIGLVGKHGFEVLNLNKLIAGVYTGNKGSEKAFRRNGYVQEGMIKEFGMSGREKLDMYWFGLTATEYFGGQR